MFYLYKFYTVGKIFPFYSLFPIFGIILGYIFLNELITPKVLVAVAAVIIGIYLVKKSNNKKITSV